MDTPQDFTLTSFFAHHIRATEKPNTVLAPEDETYLNNLIATIRAGNPAIIAVNRNGQTTYMYANLSRESALETMGKMVEATARKLQE